MTVTVISCTQLQKLFKANRNNPAHRRDFSYLRSSDGSQRALMLKRYETLDDFLSFDGDGCGFGGWPGFFQDG